MNKNYLVTGLAGSGKSTLRDEFLEQGYEAHDLDKGFASWQNQDTRARVNYTTDKPPEWHKDHHWMLELNALHTQLREPTENNLPRLFFGFTADLSANASLFDGVFILTYEDDETIRHRAENRPNPDAFGKQAGELAMIIRDREPVQATFRDLGAIAISCSLPTKLIAARIRQSILPASPEE